MRLKSIKFIATALIFALGIITVTIFGYFSSKNTEASLEKKYDNESELVLKHTILSFESKFESAERALEQLSHSNIILGAGTVSDNQELVSMLAAVQEMLPGCKGLYIGLENGTTFTGVCRVEVTNFDPRKRDWYMAAKNLGNKVVWSEPYLDYIDQRIIITASRVVSAPSGAIIGVIAVDFDVSTISQLISKSKIGTKGLVILLSSNGTVIGNKNNFMIGERPFGEAFKDRFAAKNKGELDYNIKGELYTLKFDTISRNRMVLVTAVNREEISENVVQALLPILVTGIICLMLFAIAAYFSALRGIAPLETLVASMRKAENGDYNVYADINDYYEVNSLAKSFNGMIEGNRKRDEKIKRLAYYDSLTDLPNREKLFETLKQIIEKSDAANLEVAVLYIDIDNFKAINDVMGHTTGDKVLVEIAKRLNVDEISAKIAARLGGDEFILLIDDIRSMDVITNVSNKVMDIFQNPVLVDAKSFNINASIGIALYPTHGTSVEELLKKADMAMYRAKENGKNCYKIFDFSMQNQIIQKVNIEDGLREALNNNEFVLHYQPQYNIFDKRISGMEALLRWKSPNLGLVPPHDFIKIAEETGLIVSIEKWVLKNACTFAKKINQGARNAVKVSVNISVVHIMQSCFVKNVKEIIDDVGVNPELIELEITETVMMESFSSNKKKLEELKIYGINIHLDDFGSGYSSLNYLQNLPIDYVKIDKVFVDALIDPERDGRITATIVELAHNIGLRVIAEGVELKEQLDMLTEYHCDIIQGYYLSRPIPEEEVIKLLKLGIYRI